MSEKVMPPSAEVASAKRRKGFRDAAEAYEYLTGKTMSADELADAFWYVRLRQRIVARRKATVGSQEDMASAMGTSQSEVSRLENGLGSGTRLGTLRSYLAACGTSLEEVIASLDEQSDSDLEQSQKQWAKEPKKRLVIEGHEFTGFEAEGVSEALQAVNNLLLQSSVDRQKREAFILRFLHELASVRESASSRPGRIVDVMVAVSDKSCAPLLTNIDVVENATALSTSDFREKIAEPLDLSDF
jgi:transcriptional regulator with XRE-family HTH domain